MRFFYVFLVFFLCLSCEEDNAENDTNGKPSQFEVVFDNIGSTEATISWSESFDPENETITYSVFLEGEELANNLSTRVFTLSNLSQGIEYSGKVVATDPAGNLREATFSFSLLSNQAPEPFSVTGINATNVFITLFWEEAVDPDGDAVTYQVLQDGVVVDENITDWYYKFEGLAAAQSYSFTINAIDSEGNIRSLEVEAETADGIYNGDFSAITQEGIDAFGALGYIEITGNVELDALGGFTSDITDLSPLGTILKIGGRFEIKFIDALTDLSGLNIESIGSHFRIENNQNLQSIGDMTSLIEVFGDIEIKQNSNLQSITGFNNLETVGNIIRIRNNINLIDFEGFNNVSLVNAIYFRANWLLEKIDGFNSLIKVNGDLSITDNPAINTLTGFFSLTEIDRFYVEDTLITNLDAFSALTKVFTEIGINLNSQLNSISGLSSLTEVQYFDFSIGGNPQLTSLNGLENLNAVGNRFYIAANSNLNDFCALNSNLLNSISEFDLDIINNQYNPTLAQLLNGNCSN